MKAAASAIVSFVAACIAPAHASGPQHFTGNAYLYTSTANEIVVNLDVAPLDGVTDVSFVFTPSAPVESGIQPSSYVVAADYYSEGTARLVLDDSGGQIHLDLSTGYQAVVQAPTSAVRNIVLIGPGLRFRSVSRSVQAETADRRDDVFEPNVGNVEFDSHVTRFTDGSTATSAAMRIRVLDANGVDTPVILTPAEVASFIPVIQGALDRARNGGFAPQDCRDDCMAGRNCDVENEVGAAAAAAVAARLEFGPLGGAVSTVAGGLLCYGANSIGCDIGCGVTTPDPTPLCPAGSVCQQSCSGGQDQVGQCSYGNAPGVCCAQFCTNPFIC